MKWSVRVLSVLLLSGFFSSLSAAPATPGLAGELRLPSLGMRLRSFQKMESIPVPPPELLGLRKTDQAKVVNPITWWRSRQLAGNWANGYARLVIGDLKLEPQEFTEPLTEQELTERYDKVSDESGWDEKKLAQWILLFSGRKVRAIKPYDKNLFGAICRVCELEPYEGINSRAFLIAPRSADDRVVYLEIDFAQQAFSDKAIDKSVRQLLGSISFFEPAQESARERRPGVRTVDERNHSPEYQASRNRVIDNIKNFPDWWYMETENYIFVSNRRERSSLSRLRLDLERARTIFSNYFPLTGDAKAVSVVRIFNERDEYLRYVGPEFQWSGGLWSPRHQELVISPVDFDAPGAFVQQIIRQVAFHEGFHQYFHYASNEVPNTGMWFNEGMAQYFEGMEFRGGRGVVGLSETNGRLASMLFANRKPLDVQTLVNLDYNGFYGADRDRNYALSFALIYYLFKGAAADGHPEYAMIPVRYYRAIVEFGDDAKARQAAWGNVDFTALSQQLAAFWNNERAVKKSIKAQPDLAQQEK